MNSLLPSKVARGPGFLRDALLYCQLMRPAACKQLCRSTIIAALAVTQKCGLQRWKKKAQRQN